MSLKPQTKWEIRQWLWINIQYAYPDSEKSQERVTEIIYLESGSIIFLFWAYT